MLQCVTQSNILFRNCVTCLEIHNAAVECLFCHWKGVTDILRAKRDIPSDVNFEILMFLKGNWHHAGQLSQLSQVIMMLSD